VFESAIGAFGSVDLRHVAFPASLAGLVQEIQETLTNILTNTTDDASGAYTAQRAYSQLRTMQSLVSVPSALNPTTHYSAGSNVLCNALSPPINLTIGSS
ncbi:hypothetical protein SPRG_17383, partial [Saprolegnia parasitica CBS 223.65]